MSSLNVQDPFVIQENSEKKLDFVLSIKDEEYLKSSFFNRGKRKNIEVNFDRDQVPKIKIGPYAGIVQLSNRRIHFSTKVDTRLFYMLSLLKSETDFFYDPKTPIEIKEGVNFFDVIGRFFLNYLNNLLEIGLLKKYVRKEENARFLKGKLLLKKQLRQTIIDKTRFSIEYEDLTFDNIENRIILSSLHALISLIKFNVDIKNELLKYEILLRDFITHVNIEPQICNLIKYNRVNQHYKSIIPLSKLILEERFIRSIHKGESKGFNFIVNMNKVYEDFITNIIEEIISEDILFNDYKIEKQARFKSLVKERTIITKPDIVIKNSDNEYPFIIDTKYKREDSNADYYQVIAYSLALKDAVKCCLIYPKSEEELIKEDPLTLYRDVSHKKLGIVKLYSKVVDLYGGDDENLTFQTYKNNMKDQLKSILRGIFEI